MSEPLRPDEREAQLARRIKLTGFACLAFAGGMLGLAFASAPLYDLFCRVTGFDGTPLVGIAAPKQALDRTITVRFDTNVAPGLSWSFVPETPKVEARVGETQTVFFRVRNDGSRPSTGIATFNVQPGQAGSVFVKLKCFCFDDQVLKPGETMDFPVVFYIEPAIAQDRTLDPLSTITLSYTYFASRNGKPVTLAGTSSSP